MAVNPGNLNPENRRPHPAQQPVEEMLKDCVTQRTRHTGPGGQHRNKVETAIRITHQPTGIVAFAGESRQQNVNLQNAIDRLRVDLAIQIRSVSSAIFEPSVLWQQRCRNQKINCSARHVDFPALLAEALDAIDAKDFDVRMAAATLGCSSTQLIRFLAKAPDALESVNQHRESRGQHRLKA